MEDVEISEAAKALWEAPFAVLSHERESDDPLLLYGNRAALGLFETSWEEFVGVPSRRTAQQTEEVLGMPLVMHHYMRLIRRVLELGHRLQAWSAGKIDTSPVAGHGVSWGRRLRARGTASWSKRSPAGRCRAWTCSACPLRATPSS